MQHNKWRHVVIVAMSLFLGTAHALSARTPGVVLTDQEGRDASNVPVLLAYPFCQGDIPAFPQAVIAESPLLTQAEVKTRWPDGSVRHAILAFLLPEITASSSIEVVFRNQSSAHTDSTVRGEELLDEALDFEAGLAISGADFSANASARAMIENGDYRYWLQGDLVDVLLLEDHSLARRYDMGTDEYRSIRPLFHLTHWRDSGAVKIRVIGENCNTETLQEQFYELSISRGLAAPEQVYHKEEVFHYPMSRWTKSFWLTEAPPVLGIEYNLPYLVRTGMAPNYDLSLSPVVIASDWDSSLRDLFEIGNWTKYMGTTGGRADIGPYPGWVIDWFYSWDEAVRDVVFSNADLAAAWPMHLREGDSGRFFDREETVEALGRVNSLQARPGLWASTDPTRLNYQYSNPDDHVVFVRPLETQVGGWLYYDGWAPDLAHQPDPFSAPYLLSGDYFYLEEMYFWAAWSAANANPETSSGIVCRGPENTAWGSSYGGIPPASQVRGQAWAFRNRARTAALAPDAEPEKAYFTHLVDDAIAVWEGQRNITGTEYESSPCWTWGNTPSTGQDIWGGKWSVPVYGVPTLHFWQFGSTAHVEPVLIDPEKAAYAFSMWEVNFLLVALGIGRDLGFDTDALLSWAGENLVMQLSHPDFDPYLVSAGRTPSIQLAEEAFFDSWAELKNAFQSSYNAANYFAQYRLDGSHGYTNIAFAAMAMVRDTDLPQAPSAWAWMLNEVYHAQDCAFPENPKWAILPRTDAGGGEAIPEVHDGDYQEAYGVIDLSELLRFIQFYNSDGYHCAQEGDISDEGYMPGANAATGCGPHVGDFNAAGSDWEIDLSELLRFIQLYNSDGYHRCDDPLSDEGYCLGAAS